MCSEWCRLFHTELCYCICSLYLYLSHWTGVGGSFPGVRRQSALRCSVISSENTFHRPDYPGRLHNYRGTTWSLPNTLPLKTNWCVIPSSKLSFQQGWEDWEKGFGPVGFMVTWWWGWLWKILSVSLACCSTGPVEAFQVKLKQPKIIFVREIQFGIRKMATGPRRNLQSILFSFPRLRVPLFSVSQSENCTTIL